MSTVVVTTNPNEANNVRNDYAVENIFTVFPNQQKRLTFVNGTAAERTIPAGTLVGITTADQTVAEEVKSAGTNGSQIPFGFLLYDAVIPAGAAEEVEALVGYGDDNSHIYEDKVVLDGTDTLDTAITSAGISIRNAIQAYCYVKLEAAALEISDYKDAQV